MRKITATVLFSIWLCCSFFTCLKRALLGRPKATDHIIGHPRFKENSLPFFWVVKGYTSLHPQNCKYNSSIHDNCNTKVSTLLKTKGFWGFASLQKQYQAISPCWAVHFDTKHLGWLNPYLRSHAGCLYK